jgi:hypothetical protein
MMLQRCTNPRNKQYHNYGGRGIKVCDRWLDFSKFYEDVKDLYDPLLQMDRKDNELGYCLDNVRWISAKENMRNTRLSTFITFEGVTKPFQEWVEKTGINGDTLTHRIKTDGVTKNLFKKPGEYAPVGRKPKAVVEFDGQLYQVKHLAQKLGIRRHRIDSRKLNHPLETPQELEVYLRSICQ